MKSAARSACRNETNLPVWSDKVGKGKEEEEARVVVAESFASRTFVSCCFAHLVRSAPVFATDSAVLVKSTAITSSQPANFDLKI